ncbi:hypothetical protein [Deinococcus sonorensis]|uniref:Tetratricopeptide repeat protein n=2 Tax=Deinococcus sonorensis TaxID=309891 RepID=A0AAU7U7N0_9DEIO
MTASRTIVLLPDLGDLLRLQPHYNAATVVELARTLGTDAVLWLSGPDPEHPVRDALGAAGLPVQELSPEWAWAEQEHQQLQEFLNQFPQGRERLRTAAQAEAAMQQALTGPLTLERLISADLLAQLADSHRALAAALDEGPGTRWQQRRLDTLAERLDGHSGPALAALDDLPGLLERLPQARLPDASSFAPGEASRLRALADRAEQLHEDDDLSALLDALERETGDAITPRAELDYAAAGIRLAVGDLPGARALLERAAHSLADHPRSLPGLVLARLGQVRDAQGDRDLAVRAYRAVLALGFVPQVARDTAEAGLKAAFVLDLE